jgi:molybdopterin synthase catalytic subunit
VPDVLCDVRVQEQDFSLGAELDHLRTVLGGRMGAVSTFCGLVRDREPDGGRPQPALDALYLEHFPGMTETSIQRIVDQATQRWALQAVVVVHRVGRLAVGDQIVLVLTAASHREPTLEATAFIIDLLKTDAVFWKKETWGTASRWVESRQDDHARVRGWRERDA